MAIHQINRAAVANSDDEAVAREATEASGVPELPISKRSRRSTSRRRARFKKHKQLFAAGG